MVTCWTAGGDRVLKSGPDLSEMVVRRGKSEGRMLRADYLGQQWVSGGLGPMDGRLLEHSFCATPTYVFVGNYSLHL